MSSGAGGVGRGNEASVPADDDEHEVVEGELLGEEPDVDHDDGSGGDDGDDPPALPPSGLAPS